MAGKRISKWENVGEALSTDEFLIARDGLLKKATLAQAQIFSSIITGVLLYWFGTSLVQGFALTFVLGVFVSMFSALTVTRSFLFSLGFTKKNHVISFLFSSGFHLK